MTDLQSQQVRLRPMAFGMHQANYPKYAPGLELEPKIEQQKDFVINFLPNQNDIIANTKLPKKDSDWSENKFASGEDSPRNLIYRSDDSVYDSTYQVINKQHHPLLRAAKLTKRIRKDKRLTTAQRKALKARRNIITFRIRKKRN